MDDVASGKTHVTAAPPCIACAIDIAYRDAIANAPEGIVTSSSFGACVFWRTRGLGREGVPRRRLNVQPKKVRRWQDGLEVSKQQLSSLHSKMEP